MNGPRIPGTDPAPDAQPTRTLAPNAAGHAGSTTGSNPTGSTPGTAGGPRAAPAATVDSFTMPARITCHGTVDVEVEAAYRTTGASAVVFLVDGRPVGAGALPPGSTPPGTSGRADAPTSGTYPVPMPCDGDAHTVVLTAVDGQGRTTVESRAILTDTKPAGD